MAGTILDTGHRTEDDIEDVPALMKLTVQWG